MSLSHLVYVSSLYPDTLSTLPQILEASVRNNRARGVTGMLLYSEGNIVQVLEGEKQAVDAIFLKIQRDVRHHSVFLLIEEVIPSRQFSAWSMGYHQLTQSELKNIPGAAGIFRCSPNELAVRARPGAALDILKTFADGAMGIK